jgi:hypothetical protein
VQGAFLWWAADKQKTLPRAGGEAFFVCPFQDRVNDKKVNEENSIIIEG